MTPGASPQKQFFSPWVLKTLPLLLVTGASILMVLSARGDLWHDEVWSLLIIEEVKTVLGILTFRHDNNHLLNTLFLYLVGNQTHFIVYRLLSILSGVGSLLLMDHIARKLWGNRDAILALVLCGSSFPLILIFSEARGYAPAIFFSLLAFACLLRVEDSLKPLPLLLFWAACVLGILAHATFVIIYFSLLVHSLYLTSTPNGGGKPFNKHIIRLIAVYGPPLIFMAGLYLCFFSSMIIGGGPINSKWWTLLQIMAFPLRHTEYPGITIFASIITVLLVVSGNYLLYRHKDRLWCFFTTAILVAPIFLISVIRPTYLPPRYFNICLPFFYLLTARLLSTLHTKNKWSRWTAAVLIVVFIAGNTQQMFFLILQGRGQYKAALETIIKHTAGDKISITSDIYPNISFRLMKFYCRFLSSSPKIILYVAPPYWEKQKPDWIITHGWGSRAKPLPLIVMPYIGSCSLFGEYRYSGYGSGWHWFLYKKATE